MTLLGKVRIGKVKVVSNEIVNKYGSAFTTDFDTNKKLVYQYSDITSKHLNNRVAGYVTRLLVSKKKREETLRLEEAEIASQEEVAVATEEIAEVSGQAQPAPQESAPSPSSSDTEDSEESESEEGEPETETSDAAENEAEDDVAKPETAKQEIKGPASQENA